MLRDLCAIRQRLITDIRAYDDASGARVDDLLLPLRNERTELVTLRNIHSTITSTGCHAGSPKASNHP